MFWFTTSDDSTANLAYDIVVKKESDKNTTQVEMWVRSHKRHALHCVFLLFQLKSVPEHCAKWLNTVVILGEDTQFSPF